MRIKGNGHESDRTKQQYHGCKMCKPWKHGGQPAKKAREIDRLRMMREEVQEIRDTKIFRFKKLKS